MKKLIIFLVGVSAGLFAGYKIGYNKSKKYYEHLADEEVASIKKTLKERYEGKKEEKPIDTDKPKASNKPIDTSTTVETTIKKGKKQKSEVDYGAPYRTGTDQRIPGDPGEEKLVHIKEEEVDTTKPYIITPEEFQDSEYEAITLFYCADKVLTDDDFNQINNIGIVGGYHNLDQMGLYDADCLYICDPKKGIVYEVLKEERTYSQIRPLGVVEEEN